MPTRLDRKRCPQCHRNLSLAAFNDSARAADGLAARCRNCTNARRRELDAGRTKRRPARDNLGAALRRGDLKVIQGHIRQGARPRWDWVCEALREGHLALAERLLKAGVRPNLFTMAAMADALGVSRRLRRAPEEARQTARMEPDSLDVTPLHAACSSDFTRHEAARRTAQVTVARTLTEHRADVNAAARYRGIDAATPLFCACWTSGNLDLVQWLLDAGAVPAHQDLMAALGHFQRHARPACDVAQALLDRGVPVDGSAPGERTPLQAFSHVAARKAVEWLLAHGADVAARGSGGRTAAHLAAERNTGTATLALLVENGADLTACDDDGQTPLEVAARSGKSHIVDWIRRRLRSSPPKRRRPGSP